MLLFSLLQISVPRLIPEQKCRKVEKEICNTQMINPHDIKKPVFIKYCTRKENVETKSKYLPPASPPPSSVRYPSAQPTYGQPTPQSFSAAPPSRTAKSSFRVPPPPSQTFGQNLRQKREPELLEADEISAPIEIRRQSRSLPPSKTYQRRSDLWDPVMLTYNWSLGPSRQNCLLEKIQPSAVPKTKKSRNLLLHFLDDIFCLSKRALIWHKMHFYIFCFFKETFYSAQHII